MSRLETEAKYARRSTILDSTPRGFECIHPNQRPRPEPRSAAAAGAGPGYPITFSGAQNSVPEPPVVADRQAVVGKPNNAKASAISSLMSHPSP